MAEKIMVWDELVGKTYDEALKVIKESNPNLKVDKLPEDGFHTDDFRTDRVRVFVDSKDIVRKVPRVG